MAGDTLQGRVASDELGTLGDGTGAQHTSDADYLAGLAEIGNAPAEPEREIPQAPQIPAQQTQQPVYAQQQDPQQDMYGYQQQPYGQQDPYAVYQQDPYAYQQQDPYAYQQHQQQGYDQAQAGYAQPQAAHEAGGARRGQPLRHEHDQHGAAEAVRTGTLTPDWAVSERSSILVLRSRVRPRSQLPGFIRDSDPLEQLEQPEHRRPKAGPALSTHLDHRNPLVFDTHELGRRPGAQQRLTRTVDAPKDFGIEGVIGVPEGAPVELEVRLESVMEGVLVTGTARASAQGECVRCLEPLGLEVDADFQEMFSYPDADDRGRTAEPADDAEEDEDMLFLEDGLFDLEPVLRDAVVLALPMQPVCQDDCPGLCSQCGARLADDPDHHHDAVDIRWAALQGLAGTIQDGEKDEMSGAEAGVDEKQEK